MFTRVQRIALAVLLAAVATHAAVAETLLLPLFSTSDHSAYCTDALQRIDSASDRIAVMLSSASWEGHPLLDALLSAQARGVSVRVLLDASDWAPSITEKHQHVLQRLLEGGVEAKFDDPSVTTHAKLLLVDDTVTMLGSSNWNAYALSEHRQTDIMIEDAAINAFYRSYFDAVWDRSTSELSIELPSLPSTGESAVIPLADWTDTQCYGTVLLELIRDAKQSVHVSMYRMSYYTQYSDSLSNQLIHALISAAGRGLSVKVLLDDCAYYEDSAEANLLTALYLHNRGIEVRLDAATETTHTKLVVIDERTVLLGSTNWNYYALEQNVEVNVALVGLPELGAQFEAFFQQLWAAGRRVTD